MGKSGETQTSIKVGDGKEEVTGDTLLQLSPVLYLFLFCFVCFFPFSSVTE